MSDSSIVTPQKDCDADVASSSIKRVIQRHASAADEMISSIRDELFTPPGSSSNIQSLIHDEDDKSLYDDDGELGDEIQRLKSVEDDIRQDIAIAKSESPIAINAAKPKTNVVDVNKEERNGLVFFALIVVWVVVYIKQWIEYNYPSQIVSSR